MRTNCCGRISRSDKNSQVAAGTEGAELSLNGRPEPAVRTIFPPEVLAEQFLPPVEELINQRETCQIASEFCAKCKENYRRRLRQTWPVLRDRAYEFASSSVTSLRRNQIQDRRSLRKQSACHAHISCSPRLSELRISPNCSTNCPPTFACVCSNLLALLTPLLTECPCDGDCSHSGHIVVDPESEPSSKPRWY